MAGPTMHRIRVLALSTVGLGLIFWSLQEVLFGNFELYADEPPRARNAHALVTLGLGIVMWLCGKFDWKMHSTTTEEK